MLAVDRYIKSQHGRSKTSHPPPTELIEISLYDRFGWTPEDVDKIDYGRLQRIMVALNQMEKSEQGIREGGKVPSVQNSGQSIGGGSRKARKLK